MGIFHKTLNDASKKIYRGDYDGAIKILKKHLNGHVINEEKDTLARLTKGIKEYQMQIEDAIKFAEQRQLRAAQAINEARSIVAAIERRMKRLSALVKFEE